MWYLTSSTRCAPAGPALPPVSLVSTVDGSVVGRLMLSACRLDAPPRLVDVYSLSPLGVLPEFWREAVQTALARGTRLRARWLTPRARNRVQTYQDPGSAFRALRIGKR